MLKMMTGKAALVGLVVTPALSVTELSFAQDARRLDPIVIEGTKSDQNWMDYSGTAARADATDLKNRSIRKTADLEKVFSGLSFGMWSNPSYANISLRGQPSLDIYTSNVQLYVDGVPQNHLELGQSLPFGVESAEVLYGPQGTLYGHGAAGGVINITSRKPGEGERATLESDVGTGRKSIRGSGEAKITDGLWGDLALGVQHEDNDLKRLSGQEVGGTTTGTGRVRLRYAPGGSPWEYSLASRPFLSFLNRRTGCHAQKFHAQAGSEYRQESRDCRLCSSRWRYRRKTLQLRS